MSVLFTRIRPKWFTPVAQLAILWYLAALTLLVAQQLGETPLTAAFFTAEQQLVTLQPAWLTLLSGATLLLGACATLLLATKKAPAVVLMTLTFLLHLMLLLERSLGDYWQQLGFNAVAQPLLLTVVAGYLVFLSHRAGAAGWLR